METRPEPPTANAGSSSPQVLVGRFRQLPASERRLLWPALWRLLAVRVCLTLLGIRRSLKLLGRQGQPSDQPPEWHQAARALLRVSVRLPGTRCLARAIALRWWMRRAGQPAKLVIGVRPGSGPTPEAHAWVELNSQTWDWPPERPKLFRALPEGRGLKEGARLKAQGSGK